MGVTGTLLFGFDPRENDYKLARIGVFYHRYLFGVEVFLRSNYNSWRLIKDDRIKNLIIVTQNLIPSLNITSSQLQSTGSYFGG